MNILFLALLIVFVLIIFWTYSYGAEKPQMSVIQVPVSSQKIENMVNQQNWDDMSRGLNYNNSVGYTPVMRMLSEMEKANGADIQTDIY